MPATTHENGAYWEKMPAARTAHAGNEMKATRPLALMSAQSDQRDSTALSNPPIRSLADFAITPGLPISVKYRELWRLRHNTGLPVGKARREACRRGGRSRDPTGGRGARPWPAVHSDHRTADRTADQAESAQRRTAVCLRHLYRRL